MAAQHILVIGSGVVGLLIAQGLKKQGIKCTVYESEPSASHYRPREWGMSIQWGLPLLKHIFTEDRLAQLPTACVDPFYEPPDPGRMPTLNGETGSHIKDIPLLRMYRVSRRKFRTFCAEGITIEYGKTLTAISYSEGDTVTAHFADNTTATGTLLIGADGTQSTTRHLLFNNASEADAQTVPYNAINLHVHYNDAAKARFVRETHPIIYHAIHPKGYWLFVATQDVPDPDDPATWVMQLQTTWKKGLAIDPCTNGNGTDSDIDSLEKHYERAALFGEPFRSANLWIPKGTKLSVDQMSLWHPRAWDSRGGRVVIAGDAAHPMTFHRGQGLNHGIADAANLAKVLGEVEGGTREREDAVREYMGEMVPRAGEEVRVSLMNTEMFHDWERVQQSPFFRQGGHANKANTTAEEATRSTE